MRTTIPILIALAAVPTFAAGPVETAERGTYKCELPGDASGGVGIAQPTENFVISSASRYESGRGDGVYLLRGDLLRFTTGPRKGEAYRVVTPHFLRRLEPDGKPGRLRCVRAGI